MRRSTVRQMRVSRVDAAVAVRAYIVPALKREFLSSGFDHSFRRGSKRPLLETHNRRSVVTAGTVLN
jgi:hypothetical protein